MRKDSFPGKNFRSVKSIPQFLLFYHETAPFGQFFHFLQRMQKFFMHTKDTGNSRWKKGLDAEI